ncbi:hypothetical protein Taro_054407 [Colocasia esculenta]|uniref:Transcription repressor n=1 Tax=Colocasia esculenta TaxID=4460 RepID=A0A843XR38_COLES|nr:hypothetical protein [Colocasia esculenta]
MSSSSGRRRFLGRHPAVVDLGCSCRRTKLASLFSFSTLRRSKPQPAHEPGHYTSSASPRHHHHHHHPLSSYYPFSTPSATTSATSSWETSRHPSSISTTATSAYDDCPVPAETTTTTTTSASSKGRVVESVAVVKESEDPYWDFRQSMLQMILEKEIYAWEDLQELLSSFLALNSPCHHDVILRAFTEIWGGVYPPNATSSYGEHGRPRGGHGGSGAGPRRRRRLSRERVTL